MGDDGCPNDPDADERLAELISRTVCDELAIAQDGVLNEKVYLGLSRKGTGDAEALRRDVAYRVVLPLIRAFDWGVSR